MSVSSILKEQMNNLNNQAVKKIENILKEHYTPANLLEGASCTPVIDCSNNYDEVCSIDIVYLKKYDSGKCRAVAEWSNSYTIGTEFVDALPIETIIDILECLEEDDVWIDEGINPE